MILHIFSVWDSKAEAFATPFFMHSKGLAVRAFSDTINDPNSSLSKHPYDYALFYLGTFADDSSTFKTLVPPVSLGMAAEFLTSDVAKDVMNPRQVAMESIMLRNQEAVEDNAS